MDGKGAWRDNVLSSGSGAASNTEEVYLRAYDSVAKPVLRSAGILTSTMAAGPTRALTATHPIKPTSTLCHPHGSLTPAETPLSDAENQFREPGPLQFMAE